MKKSKSIILCEICNKYYSSLGICTHKRIMHEKTFSLKNTKNTKPVWNKGLNKNTDTRIFELSKKISNSLKGKPKPSRKYHSYEFMYKSYASFRFSLNKYENEFDFSLIKEHGWYRAINNGNNPNGISRDHIFSVKQGMITNLNPFIISHPANCRLIKHTENRIKNKKCDISIDELNMKIQTWELKYGNYYDFDISEKWESIKNNFFKRNIAD